MRSKSSERLRLLKYTLSRDRIEPRFFEKYLYNLPQPLDKERQNNLLRSYFELKKSQGKKDDEIVDCESRDLLIAHNLRLVANIAYECAKNGSGKNLDEIVCVKGDDAIEEAKKLAREKGIFVGISAGANLAAAKEIAKENPEKLIVVIVPDAGDRYLSIW